MSIRITSKNLDEVVEKNQLIENEIEKKKINFLNNNNSYSISSMSLLGLKILADLEFGLFQLPIDDSYFSGALYSVGDKKMSVLNTNLPRVNMFFTAWHEIYHLYCDTESFEKTHIINDDNFIEERKAELFASKMLIGDVMDLFLNQKNCSTFEEKIYNCMSIFQAPYKAILISLYESAKKDNNKDLQKDIKQNFDKDLKNIAEEFRKYNLDESIVLPSKVTDFGKLTSKIKKTIRENPDVSYHQINLEFLDEIRQRFK